MGYSVGACDIAIETWSSYSPMECLIVQSDGGGLDRSVEGTDHRLKVLSAEGDMLTRVESVMEEIPSE